MSGNNDLGHYHAGIRAAITWLHAEALTMNDPHARQVLNNAAFGLGVAKPPPPKLGADDDGGHCTPLTPGNSGIPTQDAPNPQDTIPSLEGWRLPDRRALGRAIYLALYEHQGGKWEANETQDVWFDAADRLRAMLSALPAPPVKMDTK